jgi:hypothetical protein
MNLGVLDFGFYNVDKKSSSEILLESGPSQEDRDKISKLKRIFSRVALTFLIIGFITQIIANVLP